MDDSVLFVAVCLAVFCPLALLGVLAFVQRRHLHPIRERSPELVVAADVILFFFVLASCFRRSGGMCTGALHFCA